jgi:hypothetical protein
MNTDVSNGTCFSRADYFIVQHSALVDFLTNFVITPHILYPEGGTLSHYHFRVESTVYYPYRNPHSVE